MKKLYRWLEENKISRNKVPRDYQGNIKTNLIELELIGLNIASIINEIFIFKKLEKLTVATDSIRKLPSRISELKSLKILSLNFNELNSLPKEVGTLIKLENLFIASCDLNALPKEITNLNNLKILDLASNDKLKLTTEQEVWIKYLRNNGCDVDLSGTNYKDEELKWTI